MKEDDQIQEEEIRMKKSTKSSKSTSSESLTHYVVLKKAYLKYIVIFCTLGLISAIILSLINNFINKELITFIFKKPIKYYPFQVNEIVILVTVIIKICNFTLVTI